MFFIEEKLKPNVETLRYENKNECWLYEIDTRRLPVIPVIENWESSKQNEFSRFLFEIYNYPRKSFTVYMKTVKYLIEGDKGQEEILVKGPIPLNFIKSIGRFRFY